MECVRIDQRAALSQRQDCQDFTHKLPDYTMYISTLPVIEPLRNLTQRPPTSSILHLGRVPYSGSIRKCIDQLPSAKVRRPRHGRCCMMSRTKLKRTSTKVCYILQLASFGTCTDQSLMPRSIWIAPVTSRNGRLSVFKGLALQLHG
jgi:hypothetical protein